MKSHSLLVRFEMQCLSFLAVLVLFPGVIHAQWGYALANRPAEQFYNPAPSDSHNSSGGSIDIIHGANPGEYKVRFQGLGGGAKSTVQVTEHGAGSWECKAENWAALGLDLIAYIRCFTAAGAPANAAFGVLVVKDNISAGKQGYVWADQPSNAGYTAGAGKFFNPAGDVMLSKPDPVGNPGRYDVTFKGLGGGMELGNVQVTARGPGSETCSVQRWWADADFKVEVWCFTTAGVQAPAEFTVLLEVGDGVAHEQAYALSDLLAPMSYNPKGEFANGPGMIVIDKVGSTEGVYQVRFKALGMGNESGNVQVTAFRAMKGEVCRAVRRAKSPPDFIVHVRCFDPAGAPVDSRFSLLVEKAP